MASGVNLHRCPKKHAHIGRQKTVEANRAKHARSKETRRKERLEHEREEADLVSKRFKNRGV